MVKSVLYIFIFKILDMRQEGKKFQTKW